MNIQQLIIDVAHLLVGIALSMAAFSAVLAVVHGFLGVLLAYCAGLGAIHLYCQSTEFAGKAFDQLSSFTTGRIAAFKQRRASADVVHTTEWVLA